MKKVGIVVQRCHEEVVGGSEALAWQYATLLRDFCGVEVLTTTAKDAVSWRNELNAGEIQRDGIKVLRFQVDEERSAYWHSLHRLLLNRYSYEAKKANEPEAQPVHLHWPMALQEEFIRKQGPYSSALLSFLAENASSYDAIFFFTYLFPTTYYGILQCPKEMCMLVPTLHDEFPAHLSAFAIMAQRFRLLLWNTEAERRLSTLLWGKLPGIVMGAAINTIIYERKTLGYTYVMYSGRIDIHKGCSELIEFFVRYKRGHNGSVQLLMTGKDEIGIGGCPGVVFLGTVSDEEKLMLMAGAEAFLMPSQNESLSIVTLEAMAQGTPILVNGRSEVLRQHVIDSGGGICYTDYESFAAGLSRLLEDKKIAADMGRCGRRYVLENYSFEKLKRALIKLVSKT